MDGLMFDTEPLYKAAWQRAAESCGHPISEAMYFDLIGRTRPAGEAILQEAFGERFSQQTFRAACEQCEATVFAEQLPATKPGLNALLSLLEQHRIPKAVATSSDRRQAEALLREHGILDRFSTLATGDEVTSGKPDPEIYLLAARMLKVTPSRCLVLEDSEAGVMAGYRAGMRVWVVPDLKQPSLEIERLTRGKFASLADVADELRRLLSARNLGRLARTVLK
jgi:HAD superfamily hydrolase (TIGR01509 family)